MSGAPAELSARRWVAPLLIGVPLFAFTVVAGLQFGGLLGGAVLGFITLASLARWERSRRFVVFRADGDGVHLQSLADELAVPWADVVEVRIDHGWLHGAVHVATTEGEVLDLYTMGFRGSRRDVAARVAAIEQAAARRATDAATDIETDPDRGGA